MDRILLCQSIELMLTPGQDLWSGISITNYDVQTVLKGSFPLANMLRARREQRSKLARRPLIGPELRSSPPENMAAGKGPKITCSPTSTGSTLPV